ncbi:hypothetical protein AB0F72_03710 [Actinoplanes sp. NPDC023936]|uniref:hypothetical protein n=1 Tax=Actinoplanes sp. NPDC023936 TaxID=3154910 RepID=UPI0033C10F22
MNDVVTAEQVERHFARSAHTRALVNRWVERHGDDGVVDAVRDHRSRVVNTATLEEVKEVCAATDHALGEVKRKDVKDVRSINDWTCPFAVSHVFHFITEAIGTIPTYQEFQKQCESPRFRHMLWTPALQAIAACIEDGTPERIARHAMKWRIGNFYYSFLREQWVHAYLRSHGVMTRQHPLADALFAVDGWAGDKVISLYIGNQDYRTTNGGRKRTPRHHLRGGRPPFTFIDMELPPADSFGVVYIPRRHEVDDWIHRYFPEAVAS